MKKLLIVMVILSSVLSFYSYYGTFSYFSDTATIENVTITAGVWEKPEVEVLYSNPVLFLYCRGISKDLSFNVTPRGWKTDTQETVLVSHSGVECHELSCVGMLTNIWIRPVEGNVTLERVLISWDGGGKLEEFWVGLYGVEGINQTSPASFPMNKELRDGKWYPVTFKFRNMGLRDSYSFRITFIFEGNYSRTISFWLGDEE